MLRCRKGGKLLNRLGLDDNTRLSNKGTIKEDCPFKIRCTYNDNLWSFLIIVYGHNRELLENITADSTYRSKKLKESMHLFDIADRAKFSPRNISTLLGSTHPSTSQDIYNQKQKTKKNVVGGQILEAKLVEI